MPGWRRVGGDGAAGRRNCHGPLSFHGHARVHTIQRHVQNRGKPVHFEIRGSDRSLWSWVLLNETEETIVTSRRSFPSRTQATAAAMAFAQLVSRAGRNLGGSPRAGGFL